jgi:hypothetical protein
MFNYLVFFVILCFSIVGCTDCECPTIWAKDFSQAKFEQIQVGMDTNQVKQILGQPWGKGNFRNRNNQELQISWGYSSDSPAFEMPFCECWHYRGITFDSVGIVIERLSILYND